MEDTFLHKGLRSRLIEQLKVRGIDAYILEAFDKVPRHLFFESALVHKAYEDKAFSIGRGQTISQPFTVARQTQLLAPQKGDKILEIGTGSAFQAMILAALGADVYTIERQKFLFDTAKNHSLNTKYWKIKYFYGDGFLGLPTCAPFDKILLTAAVAELPQNLLTQLKTGGIMVLPMGTSKRQELLKIIKHTEEELEIQVKGDCSFVPMLSGIK